MKPKTSLNLRRKCLSSLCLLTLLASSSCIRLDTVRNSNTTIWEGYDPINKKVYVGKITLVVDGQRINNASFAITGLNNFLSNSTIGIFRINSTGSSGLFAANAQAVRETAITDFSYSRVSGNMNIVTRGRVFVPIKIHNELGIYYFGDVSIKYESQKLKEVEVADNPETMDLIINQVRQMNELKKYNISSETRTGKDKIYKKVMEEARAKEKNSEKKKSSDIDKAINSF